MVMRVSGRAAPHVRHTVARPRAVLGPRAFCTSRRCANHRLIVRRKNKLHLPFRFSGESRMSQLRGELATSPETRRRRRHDARARSLRGQNVIINKTGPALVENSQTAKEKAGQRHTYSLTLTQNAPYRGKLAELSRSCRGRAFALHWRPGPEVTSVAGRTARATRPCSLHGIDAGRRVS